MSWKYDLTVNGAAYSYPGGPFLKNYFVTSPVPGIYNVHLGDALAAETDVHHLGPHHITLSENDVVIFDADNDRHGWNQEWTYRSAPFTIRMTPDQIVAAKLLPTFGPNGNKVFPVNNYTFKAGAFFDNAGVTIYMPTTGERADIGLVTDPAGLFMLTGQTGPMLAWGRAGGSCPNHWIDTSTGLPIRVSAYPGMNSYSLPGYQWDPVKGTKSPYIWKGPRAPNGYPLYADDWGPQPAHYCDMHFVASISTHDPVFLRDLQNGAVFTLGESAELFLPDGRRVQAGEYRGVAHGLGMSFKARAATKHAEDNGWFVTGFHAPSTYFDEMLAPSQIYYADKMANDVACARFNVFPQGKSTIGPWQHAYLVIALAEGMLTGAPGWEPIFISAVKNTVARFSGKSGWPPAWGGYYIDLHADDQSLLPDWGAVFDQFYHGEQQNAATAAAHGQNYNPAIDTATYNKLKTDPINGFVMLGTAAYIVNDRAGMVFADYLEKIGVCDVRAQVPDFDAALANVEAFFHKYGSVSARVAFADPGVIPPIVQPNIPPPDVPPTTVPPTTQPPSGDIHMSETKFTIAPGQSKQLDFLDDAGQPAVLTGTPVVSQTNEQIFSLQLNAQGVLATSRGAPGESKITVKGQGVGELIATSVGTVARPLSSSLNLVPRAG